ncbi:MAG: hypothetical protein ACOCT9_00165 [archaeon]
MVNEQDNQKEQQHGNFSGSREDVYEKVGQDQRVSNFLSQTSPSRSLENIDYILKGYIYSSTDQEWKKVAQGIPERVRLDFLQVMTPTLSDDVRMSNLEPEDINGIMKFIIEWAVDYLDDISDDEDLTETQMTKIYLILLKAVFYTLKRGLNRTEAYDLFDSLKLGENMGPPHSGGNENKWWKFWK